MAEHTTVFITGTAPGIGTRTYTVPGRQNSINVDNLTPDTEYRADAEYERPDGYVVQSVQGVIFRTLAAGVMDVTNPEWRTFGTESSILAFDFSSTYQVASIHAELDGVTYQCNFSGTRANCGNLPYFAPGTTKTFSITMIDIYGTRYTENVTLTLQEGITVTTPFYIETLDPGYNPWIALNKEGLPPESSMQISFDNLTWENYTFGDHIEFNINRSKVYFRNSSTVSQFSYNTYNKYYYFSSSTGERDLFVTGGNIASLKDITLMDTSLSYADFSRLFYNMTKLRLADDLYLGNYTVLANYCYNEMFKGCTSLVLPPELPATEIEINCYWYMFDGCSSLTNAPDLPATIIAYGCYSGMFRDCISLVDAPDLPATTIEASCYGSMFKGCTALVSAPILRAKQLKSGCYTGMFDGCSLLDRITCLAELNIGLNCANWVRGVSTTGACVFYKSPNMSSWPTGNDGIPTGWTVMDYQN